MISTKLIKNDFLEELIYSNVDFILKILTWYFTLKLLFIFNFISSIEKNSTLNEITEIK